MSATATAAAVTAAIVGGGGAWFVGALWSMRRDDGPDLDQAAVSRAVSSALTVNPARGFETAQRIGWAELLRRGALTPVAPVITDPGSPGRWLGLFEDTTGALGMGAVRVLIGVNGSPDKHDGSHTVHGIPAGRDHHAAESGGVGPRRPHPSPAHHGRRLRRPGLAQLSRGDTRHEHHHHRARPAARPDRRRR